MSTLLPVSVVINTLNEQANLPHALRSVCSWADDIVVCDMHSEDATVAIANEYGATVCFHERVGFADPARAFAIDHARHNWILVLDADEIIPKPLSRLIAQLITTGDADAYRIPRLNYLLGQPLHTLGWGPDNDAQLRLFKKSAVKVTPDIHSFFHLKPGFREERLSYREGEAIVHFNYVDLSHFIEKLNRYASIEALQAFERGERASFGKATRAAMKEWVARYLRGRGIRSGWRGFYLTAMMSMYRIAIQGKLTELETGNSGPAVKELYASEAQRYLDEYTTEHETETRR